MSAPIIQCQQLHHVYSGKVALNNVSFELEAGEPIGLVGPNGAGKTTLLSILSGFLRPTSGTVKLFGATPGTNGLIGKVSALPQDARLDPNFTIIEQLKFYGRLQGLTKQHADKEAHRVLDAVTLNDIGQEKPQILSHGMAKRVAIAQSLMGKPALLLLDEPTAGLDPVNVRNVRSIITSLASETTFIISSHDLAELDRLCQHILLLDKGAMQQEHVGVQEQYTTTRFITLYMEACQEQEVISAIMILKGVVTVSNPQKNELIIEYTPNIAVTMDMQLIQCLNRHSWRYRQLNHGKTLEEKLFFNS